MSYLNTYVKQCTNGEHNGHGKVCVTIGTPVIGQTHNCLHSAYYRGEHQDNNQYFIPFRLHTKFLYGHPERKLLTKGFTE